MGDSAENEKRFICKLPGCDVDITGKKSNGGARAQVKFCCDKHRRDFDRLRFAVARKQNERGSA